jgi:hypothetical protein
MRKISMLICAFMLGSVGVTSFAQTIEEGTPARVRTVFPRIVQRTVIAPTQVVEPVAVVATPPASVRVVQPRVVQRTIVAPTCPECGTPASADFSRLARVPTVFPRIAPRTVVPQPCGECGNVVDVRYPVPARARVVYPRIVTSGLVAPPVVPQGE